MEINSGWTVPCSTSTYRLVLPSLSSWIAPTTLSQSLSDSATTFELIANPAVPSTGAPNPLIDSLIAFVSSIDQGQYLDAYNLAISDLETTSCRILVALSAAKQILGSVVLTWPTRTGTGKVERALPWVFLPALAGGKTGGMAYLLVKGTAQRRIVYEGLVAVGVRHYQMQQQQQGADFERCVLDCVSFDSLLLLLAFSLFLYSNVLLFVSYS